MDKSVAVTPDVHHALQGRLGSHDHRDICKATLSNDFWRYCSTGFENKVSVVQGAQVTEYFRDYQSYTRFFVHHYLHCVSIE